MFSLSFFSGQPGQSFSFIARNVKGQKLNDQDVSEAEALGARGSALGDINV